MKSVTATCGILAALVGLITMREVNAKPKTEANKADDGAFDPSKDAFVLNPLSDEHCKSSVLDLPPEQLSRTKKPISTSSDEHFNRWWCTPDADNPVRVKCRNAEGPEFFEMTILDKKLWPRNGLVYRSETGTETVFLFPFQPIPVYVMLATAWQVDAHKPGTGLFTMQKTCSGIAMKGSKN
jgi:hypothetical protein